MKFTLSWLNKYVSLDSLSPNQLAERLTMLGLEVDAVEELYVGLDAVMTAKVLSVQKHPNADRLSLCEVEVGNEKMPIVCGAPNVRPGQIRRSSAWRHEDQKGQGTRRSLHGNALFLA